MNKTNRRLFLKRGAISTVLGLLVGTSAAKVFAKLLPTPSEVEGPFYPVEAQKDKDFDLTRIEGQAGIAEGRVIVIQGQVLDTDGNPIEDVTVDLWQANAAGRYRHPHDTNKAPLDPNFQGWAIVLSGQEGRFRFKTIYPGAYPVSFMWRRTPHIHFKISKRGYEELVTQMYFPDEPLNERDRLLARKSKDEQQRMIAVEAVNEPGIYNHQLVLQKV